MNTHAKPNTFAAPQTVTTGPVEGTRKVYAAPRSAPTLSVPFREIALSDPKEPPVRIYDASGPYTRERRRDRSRRRPQAGARKLDRRRAAMPKLPAAPSSRKTTATFPPSVLRRFARLERIIREAQARPTRHAV